MSRKECVAMILAGARGERLGALTKHYSKPALHFGDGHRIIDFTLNNCINSGIDAIGILSQYLTTDLQFYINDAAGSWPGNYEVHVLPSKSSFGPYKGTADAVYKNIEFIDRYDPEHVLILSGDHIYRMDYEQMLHYHRETGADITIASTCVPLEDASRFGVLETDTVGRVVGFEEKPLEPKGNLASMGVYIFKRNTLKRYLMADSARILTQRDIDKDIIPRMISFGEQVHSYRFNGYWRDVGTVDSLWEANMDLLDQPELGLAGQWNGPCSDTSTMYISKNADFRQSIMRQNCTISGKVKHSVLSDSVTIGRGSEIVNSVIMPGVYIGDNVKITNTVVGTKAILMDGVEIGVEHGSSMFIDPEVCLRGISLVEPWTHIDEGMKFQKGSHIHTQQLERADSMKAALYEPVYQYAQWAMLASVNLAAAEN